MSGITALVQQVLRRNNDWKKKNMKNEWCLLMLSIILEGFVKGQIVETVQVGLLKTTEGGTGLFLVCTVRKISPGS